jgi:predicted patatin/cPLA2 family phospholipase
MKTFAAALALGLIQVGTVNAEKCYALAFSGGKENGAYQAGAMSGLASELAAADIAYDVVSGVSAGALNGALFSSFPAGQEKEAAAKMVSFWTEVAKTKLYQSWWGGLVEGLLTEGGLYDNSPMEGFFKDQLKGLSLHRDLFIGLTDVLSGNFEVLTNSKLTESELPGALQASFSFPGVFPPYSGFDSEYFDGDSIYNVDIFSAVNECLKKTGGNEADVVVDVIMTNSDTLEKVDASKYHSISMLYRFLQISDYYGSMDGLLRAKFAYKDVDFRYTITPSKSLPWNFTPLDMSDSQIADMISLGESDAKKAVAAGPKLKTEHLVHYYSLIKTKDAQVKGKSFEEFMEMIEANQAPEINMEALKFLQN